MLPKTLLYLKTWGLSHKRLSRIPFCTIVRTYSARRALMYVPGDDNRKLQKALTLKVDCIVMDCEDGVAANRKNDARATIRSLLDHGTVSTSQPEWAVRLNSIDSGLCNEDMATLLSGTNLLPTLLLPKVESVEHIQWFADTLTLHLNERKSTSNEHINLIIYIESARAIMDLPTICKKAEELSARAPFTPVALVFGSDDLCASLGAVRSDGAEEMLYARQRLVLVAKAYRLQAIDMVHIQYKDLEGLKKHCELGARMGYTGKQVIHPDQVPIVQTAFLPSLELVSWAKGLVTAFQEHQAKGKGAFVYKGSMIDMPALRQAQNILQLTDSVKDVTE